MIVDVAGAAAALQAADDILILTHRRPDGDTAGCAGALCRGLQQIGKRAYILENPEITRRYAPLIVPSPCMRTSSRVFCANATACLSVQLSVKLTPSCSIPLP